MLHVYGSNRDDVMFGAGWVAAEDRGLLMEEALWAGRVAALDVPGLDGFKLLTSLRTFIPSAQTEAFIHSQVRVLTGLGAKGTRVLRDFQDLRLYGINAFYRQTEPAGSRPPAWTVNEEIAVFLLIGSVFGHGGGDEVRDSDLLAVLEARIGRSQGLGVFRDLRRLNDPEAPVSIPARSRTAPTQPGQPRDRPSSTSARIVPSSRIAGLAVAASPPRQASNALLVEAGRSATGHPLAVMGPQVGYYYP